MTKLKEKLNEIKLSGKKLYLIASSDKFETQDDFLDAVASSLQGGVDILQLSEKNISPNKILQLGKKVKQLCLQFDTTFIVNDRIDIAALLEADGVHLGQEDLGVKEAREILGPNAIVGISAQEPAQALKAIEDGADYLCVGPVFETSTSSKKATDGLEYVKWVSENIQIPAFAIGGIDLKNVQDVLDMGSNRIATDEAILNSKSPEKSAENFLSRLG